MALTPNFKLVSRELVILIGNRIGPGQVRGGFFFQARTKNAIFSRFRQGPYVCTSNIHTIHTRSLGHHRLGIWAGLFARRSVVHLGQSPIH